MCNRGIREDKIIFLHETKSVILDNTQFISTYFHRLDFPELRLQNYHKMKKKTVNNNRI